MSPMQDPGTGGMPDSPRYFLQTERLGFRPWIAADLDLAMGLWGDGEVTKLIGGPFSQEQVQTRLSLEISNLKTYGVQYWPVFLLSSALAVNHPGEPSSTQSRWSVALRTTWNSRTGPAKSGRSAQDLARRSR